MSKKRLINANVKQSWHESFFKISWERGFEMIGENRTERERNQLAWLDEKENYGENPMKTSKHQTNPNQSRVANIDTSSLPPAAGFTLIELLVVIAIIGILAGLTVTLSEKASSEKKRRATQGLLNQLEIEIESYKTAVDLYPYFDSAPPDPDNDGRVNVGGGARILLPAMNPLFYELTGTVFNPQTRSYTSTQGGDGLRTNQCQSLFGIKGFYNVTLNPDKTKFSIENANEFAPISVNPTVNLLLAPVKWPKNTNNGSLEQYRPVQSNDDELRMLNPWQYRAPGIKNSESFDLWADVLIGNKVHRINNWRVSKVFDRNN